MHGWGYYVALAVVLVLVLMAFALLRQSRPTVSTAYDEIVAEDEKMGPYRHPPFGDEVRAVLQQIKDRLNDVYPLSLDQWEDGFRRDTNAEREIAIWLVLSACYDRHASRWPAGSPERMDVFRVLLVQVKALDQSELELERLTANEAQAIVDDCFSRQADAQSGS